MGSKTTTTQQMPEFQQEFLEETVLPYATSIAEREFTPYTGERVAGMTPLQQQAISGYGGLNMGGTEYGQAANIYGQLGSFQAPSASAAQLAAAERVAGEAIGPEERIRGVGAVRAAQAPEQIDVDTLRSADMARYMSPYTQGVIESSLRTLGGAQEQALDKLAAQAQAARAFGGSRQGIAEAETRKAYGQQAADLVTKQPQQAFQQAQGAAQFDIGQTQAARTLASQQGMQAQTLGQQAREAAAAREQAARAGNQAAANQFAQREAELRQQANLANQQAANQFAVQQAQFQQAANLANQQAALQAANVRAQAAAGLGATAGQRLQSQMAGLGAQMQAGEAARSLDQARLDAQYAEFARQQDFPLTGLNALATAASGIPSGYGTTTQSYGGLGPALGAIGSFGMGMGPQGFGLFGR